VVVGVVAVVAICVAGLLYLTKLELAPGARQIASAEQAAAPPTVPSPSLTPTATQAAQAPPPPPAPSPSPASGKFSPESVPFIADRVRLNLANEYVSGADHKAFAINNLGVPGIAVGQPNEEAARTAALDQCQKRSDSGGPGRRCELYAVGNVVVYPHGKPPVPPAPWISHDPPTERPFSAKETPLVRDQGKSRLEAVYVSGRKSRTIAVGPGGQFIFNTAAENVDESARRSLESCGFIAGVPCMIVAAEDVFVVPVPVLMRAIGFFKAASSPSIAGSERDAVARRLADAPTGWNAVAVGTTGHAGVAVKAASEQNAINDALGNCAKRDSDCHVIAIGPFAVGPNN
jgi:adenylate cyclase